MARSNKMQVLVRMDKLGNLHGTPVKRSDHDRIVAEMNENGAELPTDRVVWPLFVQGTENALEALRSMEVDTETVDSESPFAVRVAVDPWTFRQLCGYCSS